MQHPDRGGVRGGHTPPPKNEARGSDRERRVRPPFPGGCRLPRSPRPSSSDLHAGVEPSVNNSGHPPGGDVVHMTGDTHLR